MSNILFSFLLGFQAAATSLIATPVGSGSLFTYEGILTSSDGTPITAPTELKLQILADSNCVVYEEKQSVHPGSAGEFSVIVGTGARTDSTGNTANLIFSAAKTVSCFGSHPTGQVTVNGTHRTLRIYVNGQELSPDVILGNVPTAINAQKLEDKGKDDFVNINDTKGVTQSHVESIFDRFTKLDAILNGFNNAGTSAGINIIGNASTATTATTAGNVTGTVAIANGGTGATDASGARASLGLGSLATMSPTGADGTKFLRDDGTWQAVSGGGAVSSVAGKTGAVVLSNADISGLGALATKSTSGTADTTTYLRGDGAWTALGGAASLNVGTGAGTVAAGNDSRIAGAVQNVGTDAISNVAAFSAGLDINKPGSPVAGQMFVATDVQKIYRYDGSAWITVAEVGGSGSIGSLSGDVSGVPTNTIVDKIKGQTVTATASTAGQVLRYAGGNNWTPGFVAMTDLRSTVTGSNSFLNSCSANQTLTYNSVGDMMNCQAITGVPAANISGLQAVAKSGSYDDLSNKPTIPAAQVNVDWNAASGVAQILNKPNLGAFAFKNSVDLSGTESTGTLAAARMPALTGDVTLTPGTINTTSIVNNAVKTTKIADSAVTDAKIDTVSGSKITGTVPAGTLPVAGGSAAGIVSTLAQSFSGLKTFSNGVIVNGTLEVNGAVVSIAQDLGTNPTEIDFATGNTQYTSASCKSFDLKNIKEGGVYQLIIQGTSPAIQCSFAAVGFTVKYPPDHGVPMTGKHTIYSFLRAGSFIYVSWVPGY